jgi:hypothetical protein
MGERRPKVIPRHASFTRDLHLPTLELQLDDLFHFAAQVRAGSYVGSGRAKTVEIGLHPAVLFIIQQGAAGSTGSMSVCIPALVGLSYHINGNLWMSDGVTGVSAGIMTLGVNVVVNRANTIYSFVAMG